MHPTSSSSSSEEAEIVCLLLECGANADAEDKAGNTPLHLASFWGRTEVMRLLLDHGAILDVEDNEGRTPLRMASWDWRRETKGLHRRRDNMVPNYIEKCRLRYIVGGLYRITANGMYGSSFFKFVSSHSWNRTSAALFASWVSDDPGKMHDCVSV